MINRIEGEKGFFNQFWRNGARKGRNGGSFEGHGSRKRKGII